MKSKQIRVTLKPYLLAMLEEGANERQSTVAEEAIRVLQRVYDERKLLEASLEASLSLKEREAKKAAKERARKEENERLALAAHPGLAKFLRSEGGET